MRFEFLSIGSPLKDILRDIMIIAALLSIVCQVNTATVPAIRDQPEKGWYQRHEAMIAANLKIRPNVIFIGDSITHAFGGEPDTKHSFEGRGKATWDKYYTPIGATNLGYSGDRTQHVLWRLDNGELAGIWPKVAVVMIGTNNITRNTPAEIAEGVKAVCMRVRSKLPSTKVLLLAIFPRHGADSGSRKAVNETNEILKTYGKIPGINYLDIGKVFVDKDGNIPPEIMPDKLHPSAEGYKRWAEAMEPTFAKLVGRKPIEP